MVRGQQSALHLPQLLACVPSLKGLLSTTTQLMW
jgi:hypothetical protein